MNMFDHFYDAAFIDDGLHLKDWNDYYLFSLNRKIVLLLPDLKNESLRP